MKVTEDQFRFEWFSGTGKGGQHRNKHQNCCRCIHEPTGIQANGTNSRSREDNKQAAYNTCLSRVVAHFHKDTDCAKTVLRIFYHFLWHYLESPQRNTILQHIVEYQEKVPVICHLIGDDEMCSLLNGLLEIT